jgi:hypothetical protein
VEERFEIVHPRRGRERRLKRRQIRLGLAQFAAPDVIPDQQASRLRAVRLYDQRLLCVGHRLIGRAGRQMQPRQRQIRGKGPWLKLQDLLE